ncbi:hypothetical protein Tco_0064558 [Tanacetum coccineum]
MYSLQGMIQLLLNKAMAFLIALASSRFPSTNNQLRTSSNPRNQATIQDGRVIPKRPRNASWYKEKEMLAKPQEAGQILDEEQLAFLTDPRVPDGQAVQTISPNNAAFQTEDLDTYDSDCDDISNAQAVLMANISNYGSDVISEVPPSDTYLNDMENQSVHAMQDFEQTPVVDFTDNKIHSDSNIISYSQYLQETQQENVQDTHLQAQQDSMILSVIEQMSEQMINHVNNWEKANKEQNNESVTAELERYKERVKTFEQRLNIDLSSREKMIDSQMDDMIREKLALKEQVDSLEQNLSKQIKEKECLLQTFTVFKNESKEKEDKYMENEIDLEKKIKELDNILFKVGQSAQTVHMLTKPQAFYDNIHKQALGYQNPFHLKKAQRIKPTLYDGIVMSDKHVAMPVIDDEETLILEEESRSKMSEKSKGSRELSAKQAFWLRMSDPTSKPSDALPVKIEAPMELPKISLVNESLKKLKFHLAKFDNVVKIRTTPNARTEVMNSMSLIGETVNMDGNRKESCNIEAELLKSQNAFNDLLKQFFENNDLKAQLQDKDSTICKLKDMIKSMRENSKDENVKYDYCEIETKNVFKEQFDSIKKKRVHSKEQSGSLIDKLNLKSAENEDLKTQIQDKVFVITSLKNDLRKIKGKEIVDIATQIPSASTIVPGIFKLDLEPLTPKSQ